MGTRWTPERRARKALQAKAVASRPEVRQAMRATWTPERRAAQALRAKAMPAEARRRGGVKGGAKMKTEEARRAAQARALEQWSDPGARLAAKERMMRKVLEPEWRAAFGAGMRRMLGEYWTPPRRQEARERAWQQYGVKPKHTGFKAWPKSEQQVAAMIAALLAIEGGPNQ